MEEIKLNMQNLTKEEREQLLKLINKANERADLESKKQELLKKVLDNYKAFYGDNYNKMRNHISVFTRLAKDTIGEFLDNGFEVCIVSGPSFNLVGKTAKVEMHCDVRQIDKDMYDLSMYDYVVKYLGLSSKYKLYIYLPAYKDLNDKIYKSCWTFRYNLREEVND